MTETSMTLKDYIPVSYMYLIIIVTGENIIVTSYRESVELPCIIIIIYIIYFFNIHVSC